MFLKILLIVVFAGFTIYETYTLIRDIRKHKKEQKKVVEKSDNNV